MIKKLKNNTKKAIISTVERTSNVATVVTSTPHGYTTETAVHVFAQDSSYDTVNSQILSVPTASSFTYSNAGADEGTKADTGSVGKTKNVKGWEIFPDAYFILPEEDEEEWRSDPSVESDLAGDQELLFNDGVADITDPDEGTALFDSNDATYLKGVLIDDAAKANSFILKYNSANNKLEYVSQIEEYAESLGNSATTDTNWVQKLRLTTTSLPAGDYEISWYGEQSTDKAIVAVDVQVQVDDTTTIVSLSRQLSSPYYYPFCGFIKVTLGAGVHNIDLDHRTKPGSGTGSQIKNVVLNIRSKG